jgi:hypothetical protein
MAKYLTTKKDKHLFSQHFHTGAWIRQITAKRWRFFFNRIGAARTTKFKKAEITVIILLHFLCGLAVKNN